MTTAHLDETVAAFNVLTTYCAPNARSISAGLLHAKLTAMLHPAHRVNLTNWEVFCLERASDYMHEEVSLTSGVSRDVLMVGPESHAPVDALRWVCIAADGPPGNEWPQPQPEGRS